MCVQWKIFSGANDRWVRERKWSAERSRNKADYKVSKWNERKNKTDLPSNFHGLEFEISNENGKREYKRMYRKVSEYKTLYVRTSLYETLFIRTVRTNLYERVSYTVFFVRTYKSVCGRFRTNFERTCHFWIFLNRRNIEMLRKKLCTYAFCTMTPLNIMYRCALCIYYSLWCSRDEQ